MTREQLAHLLRSAVTIAKDGDILVIATGDPRLLPEEELPEGAWLSVEADPS